MVNWTCRILLGGLFGLLVALGLRITQLSLAATESFRAYHARMGLAQDVDTGASYFLEGFTLGLITSWLLDHSPDRIFLDASVGCLVGAVLFRWYWTIVLGGLRDTLVARYRASVSTPAPVAPAAPAAAKAK